MRVRRWCQVAGAAVALALGLAGCSLFEDSLAIDAEFVGRWCWEFNPGNYLALNDDGTASIFEANDFTWGVSGEELRWRMGADQGNETWRWSFTFEGDGLTLVSRQEAGLERTYFRCDDLGRRIEPAGDISDTAGGSIEDQLTGLWLWDGNNSIELVFHADGTGDGYLGPFEWEISGNQLLWHFIDSDYGDHRAYWGFSLADDVLDIVMDLEIADDFQGSIAWTYQRALSQEFDAGASIEDQLVGLWLWDADGRTELVFHADGTGDGYMGFFEWEISDNELIWHLLDSDVEGERVYWGFSLDADVMDIVMDRHVIDPQGSIVWTYVRANSN